MAWHSKIKRLSDKQKNKNALTLLSMRILTFLLTDTEYIKSLKINPLYVFRSAIGALFIFRLLLSDFSNHLFRKNILRGLVL